MKLSSFLVCDHLQIFLFVCLVVWLKLCKRSPRTVLVCGWLIVRLCGMTKTGASCAAILVMLLSWPRPLTEISGTCNSGKPFR